jgi:cytochrome c55X
MSEGRSAILAGFCVLLLVAGSAAAAPSLERQEELIHRLKHDCGSCHGLTLKGGLGPPLLPSTLASRDDEALMDVILEGIAGTPMPPWQGELSAEEARWLVRILKEGAAL